MTIEEKVGQLFLVGFIGQEAEDAKILIEEAHIGGILYFPFANGLENLHQVKTLSEKLQRLSKIPLFIAVDQEGGRVNSLKFTQFPSQAELGKNSDDVYKTAKNIAEVLKSVGININLAPVVDVNSNPNNPVIGSRSFSPDPEIVAFCGKKALEGYKESGIFCCLKHFPGHGDTASDSHLDLPIVNKTKLELERVEFLPFKRLLPNAEFIMTAHLLIPALDSVHPATFSKTILTKLLREEWGYQGLVVSDSLIMQGLYQHCASLPEASLKAFNAGCDLLCIGGKIQKGDQIITAGIEDLLHVYRFFLKAVKTGEISEQRLNESVERILLLKEKL